MQQSPEADPEAKVAGNTTETLYGEVAAMNPGNFIVRMKRQAVDHFRDRKSWDRLSEDDRQLLSAEVATLPTELEYDDVASRMFDLTALRLQLAVLTADQAAFERYRKRVLEIAAMLEEKTSIPAVAQQLEYLQALQDPAFWDGMDVPTLEEMRLRLRGVVPFLDKKRRKVVYTDFKDEVMGVREDTVLPLPRMTSVQYEKKVREYLRNHLDNIVIHRLRTNRPLTASDLEALENMLASLGENDGRTLLSDLLERTEAPSWRTSSVAWWAWTKPPPSRPSPASWTIPASPLPRSASWK